MLAAVSSSRSSVEVRDVASSWYSKAADGSRPFRSRITTTSSPPKRVSKNRLRLVVKSVAGRSPQLSLHCGRFRCRQESIRKSRRYLVARNDHHDLAPAKRGLAAHHCRETEAFRRCFVELVFHRQGSTGGQHTILLVRNLCRPIARTQTNVDDCEHCHAARRAQKRPPCGLASHSACGLEGIHVLSPFGVSASRETRPEYAPDTGFSGRSGPASRLQRCPHYS